MPRSLYLTLIAACLAATSTAAQIVCDPSLDVASGPDGKLSIELDAPCHPYAAVSLEYGPFTISEETSDRGRLELDLPEIAGVERLTARFSNNTVEAILPTRDERTQASFIAMAWRGTPGFAPEFAVAPHVSHDRLGFPTQEGDARHYIYYYVTGVPESGALDIRVDAAQCGRDVSATLVTSSDPQPREIDISLPSCGASGLKLRLPLDPS